MPTTEPARTEHACRQSLIAMPPRNNSAVQMLAWNITWPTPLATASSGPTPTSDAPGSTRGRPMARPRKYSAQVTTMNGAGVRREGEIPPRQPGHDRRRGTADDEQDDGHHAGLEEEQRRDPHQRGVEAVDAGGHFVPIELQGPGDRRADRRADEPRRPP